MSRARDTWIIAGLCAAWAIVIVRMGLTPRLNEIDPPAEMAWRALPDSERASLVRSYQEILRRADGRRVLIDAQRFAAMTPDQQAALLATHVRMQKALRGPASTERWLAHLAPSARATAIHRIIMEREAKGRTAGGGGAAAPCDAE